MYLKICLRIKNRKWKHKKSKKKRNTETEKRCSADNEIGISLLKR